jgi:hypothetical protein
VIAITAVLPRVRRTGTCGIFQRKINGKQGYWNHLQMFAQIQQMGSGTRRYTMKKISVFTVAMLVSASAAWAYGDHHDWDCGNDVIVTAWKSEFSLSSAKPRGSIPVATASSRDIKKRRGSVSLKIEWDAEQSKVWLNGKECHYMSDMDWYRRWCAEDPDPNSQACQEVKATDEMSDDK